MSTEPIDRGAVGDIFAWGDAQVVKVFRRQQQTHRDVIDWLDHEALTRLVFRSEVDAYVALSRKPELAVFAPQFGGVVPTSEMVDRLGLDASKYVTDCAFAMERIVGRAQKLGSVSESLGVSVGAVLKKFHSECGIAYTVDASVFAPAGSRPLALIDFAMQDVFNDYQPVLEEHGVFPRRIWNMLKLE